MIKLAIVTIGNELISGKILNSNLKYFSEILYNENIDISAHFVCKDDEEQIKSFLNFLSKDYDIIIISGGLGPTSDDITRFAASSLFDKKLIKNEIAFQNLLNFYKNRQMPESNLVQTLLPEDSIPIENKNGTACGFKYIFLKENKKTYFYFIPGVPKEALPMIKDYIIPDIKKNFSIYEKKYNINIFLSGISESQTYENIKNYDNFSNFEKTFEIGFYPSHYFIKISINFKKYENELLNFLIFLSQNFSQNILFYSFSDNFLNKLSINFEFIYKNNISNKFLDNSSNNNFSDEVNLYNKFITLNKKFLIVHNIFYINLLKNFDIIKNNNKESFKGNQHSNNKTNTYETLYFYDILKNKNEILLEYILYKLLYEKNLTLSIAESCTGGLLSSKITNISGSSNIYKGAIIAYSNEIKENILKVPKDILFKKGAVSDETVIEMAKNAKYLFNSDISVSISGIAGPTGGSLEKPVGLVYICLNIKNDFYTYNFTFPFDRIINKERFANITLYLLINKIMEIYF